MGINSDRMVFLRARGKHVKADDVVLQAMGRLHKGLQSVNDELRQLRLLGVGCCLREHDGYYMLNARVPLTLTEKEDETDHSM